MAQPVGFERAPWQVRIRRQLNQLPAGGGMFCGDGYVVTCAHVISQDAAAPVGPVYVEFQLFPSGSSDAKFVPGHVKLLIVTGPNHGVPPSGQSLTFIWLVLMAIVT